MAWHKLPNLILTFLDEMYNLKLFNPPIIYFMAWHMLPNQSEHSLSKMLSCTGDVEILESLGSD